MSTFETFIFAISYVAIGMNELIKHGELDFSSSGNKRFLELFGYLLICLTWPLLVVGAFVFVVNKRWNEPNTSREDSDAGA